MNSEVGWAVAERGRGTAHELESHLIKAFDESLESIET
jgi:hypothetical protein